MKEGAPPYDDTAEDVPGAEPSDPVCIACGIYPQAEAAFVAAVNAPSRTGRGIAVPHLRDVEAIWAAIEPFLPEARATAPAGLREAAVLAAVIQAARATDWQARIVALNEAIAASGEPDAAALLAADSEPVE